MSYLSFFNFHQSTRSSPKPSRKLSAQASMPSSKGFRQRSSAGATTTARDFEPTVEEMKWAFDKFDSNNDGKISPEEYKAALKALDREIADSEVVKAFQVVDSDGDGYVDFKEFVEMFKMGGGSNASEVQSAFKVFDLDGDGKISAKELSQVLKQLGESCSMKACQNMVKGVDMDGDGFIDIDEFTKMMLSTGTRKPT